MSRTADRPLGLVSAAGLVVASMIGAGVFTTSGFALSDLHSPGWVLVAWAVGGGIALLGAVSYGELARRMAESGGEYLYLSRAVHPLAGFLAGWVSLLAGFTGAIAFAAVTFEEYALSLEGRPPWLPQDALAVVAIGGCGMLHAAHVRRGTRTQNVVVGAQVAALLLFVLWAVARGLMGDWGGGVPAADTDAAGGTSSPGVSAFAFSLVWISLSYCGFNAAVYVAGEVRDAERTVPWALVAATLFVAALYLLLNTVFLYAPALDAVRGRPDVAAPAARALGGPGLEAAVRTVVALGLFASVSGMVLAGPRVYAKMAADGLFPRIFDTAAGPPRAAVLFQTVLAIGVVIVSTLQDLLSYLAFTLSLSSAAAVATLLLPRPGPAPARPPRPATAVAATLYVVVTVGLAGLGAWHRPHQFTGTAATLASGAVAYLLATRWNRRRRARALRAG